MSSVMPDLVSRGTTYRHTQASALESLVAAGVAESRISFRFEGSGGAPGLVAAQHPEPGASLDNIDRVVITISGFGLFHHLPFGMRLDTRNTDQVSTSDLLGLFDSEMVRLQYWRDEAPLLFGIGPECHEANARWLRLFGIDPDLWPRERHFSLCTLVPSLHRIAGTEDGVRLVLRKMLDIEIAEFRYRRNYVPVSARDMNSLEFDPNGKRRSARNLRLGLDTVLGRRVERARSCELRLGPLSLDQWRDLTSSDGANRLKQALYLCMPIGVSYTWSFLVGDPDGTIELGSAERNSVLGVNTRLVRKPPVNADKKTPREWSYA